MHQSSEQRATSLGTSTAGTGGVPGVTAPLRSNARSDQASTLPPPGPPQQQPQQGQPQQGQQGQQQQQQMSKAEMDGIQKQKAQVLRQQQQRLLLLRHASKCKYGTPQNPQTCPATKHCREMKQLWQVRSWSPYYYCPSLTIFDLSLTFLTFDVLTFFPFLNV